MCATLCTENEYTHTHTGYCKTRSSTLYLNISCLPFGMFLIAVSVAGDVASVLITSYHYMLSCVRYLLILNYFTISIVPPKSSIGHNMKNLCTVAVSNMRKMWLTFLQVNLFVYLAVM